MQAVSDPGLAPILVQQLIVGVKSGLASFSSSKVVFTHKECNNAAHLLARHARQISDCTIWVEDTPPWLFLKSLVMYLVWVLALFKEMLNLSLSKKKKKKQNKLPPSYKNRDNSPYEEQKLKNKLPPPL